MAEDIRMSPEEMDSKAAQFDASCNEFEEVRASMQNLVNSLCEQWAGASSTAFSNQFDSLRPGFDATRDLITDIAIQLRDISTSMQSFDQEIASKIGK